MHPVENILPDLKPFLDKVFLNLFVNAIHIQGFEMDHICYRVETDERYETLKKELSTIGEMINESDINGRQIAVFKLEEPVRHEMRDIYLIELPAPKKGRFYKEGYEHVEFVIDYSLEDFVRGFEHIDFDKKGMDKEINPDVRIQFEDISVKFHEYDLEYVIDCLDELRN
ncbi:MAG: putative metalloenzyme YecM [Paraglaciecola sp.]|jgi:predicted metalloenzyme YecM